MRSKFVLLAAILSAPVIAVAETPAKLDPAQVEFFEKSIRPALVEHCYRCHSAGAEKGIKGGLLVDSRDGLLTGGDSGPAIVPGKANQSLLIKAMRYDDSDLQMPPKEKMASNVIADFEAWVNMGAPDPRTAEASAQLAMGVDLEQARTHWAFQPVANPPVPKVQDRESWIRTPIDAFILAKLKEQQLAASPAADRRTLIRRATYDLIGLPPTPEEVEAFVQDQSADAFAKVVDRLLSSSHYGERWGRHWLDVARYADHSGDRSNRGDQRYPFAWTYRDYVIDAFNQDLPYDRFILEQIAGDLLPRNDDPSPLAAVGFLTVGKRFMNNFNEVIDDRIDVVTQGLIGLTVSCARCHDHKFDPIPTKDYYSLHGVFANSIEPRQAPLLVNPNENPNYEDFQKKLAVLEKEMAAIGGSVINDALAKMRQQAGDYLLATYWYPLQKDKSKQRALLGRMGLNQEVFDRWKNTLPRLIDEHGSVLAPWAAYTAFSEAEFPRQAKQVTEKIAADQSINPLVAQALVQADPKSLKAVAEVYNRLFKLVERNWQAAQTKSKAAPAALPNEDQESLRQVLYARNSPMQLPDQMARRLVNANVIRNLESRVDTKINDLKLNHPGSPARAMALEDSSRLRDSRVFIRGEPRNFGPVVPRQFLEILAGEDREPFKQGSGRLELAQAIASRDNPLTARVMVNRIWQRHFGEAIVRTPSDFGLRSDPPTHPELLDWLATWFMDNGWSMKKLHRLIMLSSVYQQSSQNNEAYAEIDPANEYLWRMNLQRLDFESVRDTLLMVGGQLDRSAGGPPADLTATPHPGRRTVYGFINRQNLPELFRTFDFANPDMTSGQRYLTTVPQQALFMMNSPLVVEQAKNLVNRRDVQARNEPEARIHALFRIVFQRAPTSQEVEIARDYLARNEAELAATERFVEPTARVELADRRDAKASARSGRGEPKSLNSWEKLAQVLLLTNEMIFVN